MFGEGFDPEITKFIARRKRPAAERKLGLRGAKTQVLPAVPQNPEPIEDQPPRRPVRQMPKTQRLKRPDIVRSCVELSRLPLLAETVTSSSVSPITRPDLIGKTIAGGQGVKGATDTSKIGLRSSPSGYAVKAHLAIPPGRYKKGRRKKKRRK